MRNPQSVRVLLLEEEADRLADVLRARFPQIGVVACSDYDGVAEVIARHAPQVVMASRGRGRAFPRGVIVDATCVEWIQAAGAGVDHWRPWHGARQIVTTGSGIHSDVVQQYAIGAMTMFNQNFATYVRQQVRAEWRQLAGRSLRGQTLVVLGLGHMGSAVARGGRLMGMQVIGVRASPRPTDAADICVGLDALDDVLGKADHLAITLPLTDATRGSIGARTLALLPRGAHIINISRGGIVDEDALMAALTAGQVGGATLDVFATEPLGAAHPFWSMETVVITPHVATNVHDWKLRSLGFFGDNLERWLAGQPLLNVIDPARGY